MPESRARGRVVVIAGASSATGKAVATALAAAGARVVAVGSNEARLADVAAEARYVCDLTDPIAVTALANQIRDEVGPVDGVIHLVGGWMAGRDNESWGWLSSRILTTLRATSIAFRDDLAASSAGRFAIVSSTSVDKPTWSNANYATAKAAAEAWVAALGSGWAKGGTAAAVTFVVTAIGDDANSGQTPPEALAARISALWDSSAEELNGARIRVAGSPA